MTDEELLAEMKKRGRAMLQGVSLDGNDRNKNSSTNKSKPDAFDFNNSAYDSKSNLDMIMSPADSVKVTILPDGSKNYEYKIKKTTARFEESSSSSEDIDPNETSAER
jgi:hypothetical protein